MSMEAERAVIGSMMSNAQAAYGILDDIGVDESYFAYERTRRIFRTARSIRAAGEPVDQPTLQARTPALPPGELLLCTQAFTGMQHLPHWIGLLDMARKRRFIVSTLHAGMQRVEHDDPDQTAAWLVSQISRHAGEHAVAKQEEVEKEMLQRRSEDALSGRLSSGIRKLDELIGGYVPGKTTIVAGRASVGKTIFAVNELVHTMRHEVPVCMVSLEMDEAQLRERIACESWRFTREDLERCRTDTAVRERFVTAARSTFQMPMTITDRPLTVQQACTWIGHQATSKGAKLAVIDYIQLFRSYSPGDKRNRNQELADASQALLATAKLSKVHVLMVSQLNREPGSDEPELHHLRDSGALEQDASNVIMLWKGEENLVNMKVAKSRDGQCGRTTLRLSPDIPKLMEIDSNQEDRR